MSNFKIGDYVETVYNKDCAQCLFMTGQITEVITCEDPLQFPNKVLYRIKWSEEWTYDESEIQLEEEYNGN